MQSKLQAALSWAARGFKVFPLLENDKTPVYKAFTEHATVDAHQISSWWRDPVTGIERDYNIGVLTTDIVVADVDVKQGKPGLQEYQALGGHSETLVVRTPTGGWHCYFNGPDSSLAPLGKGLDIRSHNGYVLAPGSTIDGTPYELVVDKPMAWVPLAIEANLREPGRRADRDDDLVDLDTPSAIANATAWAEHTAPLAVEGAGGDNTAYAVSCKLVRDYGLTEETAYEILARHWNERCAPPWSAGELWAIVEHASDYSTGDLGSARPEATFGGVALPEPQVESFEHVTGFGNALDLSGIPKRPWLMHRLLMRRAITLVPAAGSSGKSLLALTIAAHLAMGQSFGNYEITEQCKSIVYNAEDDMQELSRRLYATCQEYKFDYPTVRDNIMLLSSDTTEGGLPLNIAYNAGRNPVANDAHVNFLIQAASDPAVGFVALDPLVEIHGCDEQDNMQMRFVMGVLRQIARDANVALFVPHHSNKPGGGQNTMRAGSADVSRGASSIVNSARIVLTLFGASDQDREAFGIGEDERHKYVRLDDAKMNLTLASSASTWFEKRGTRLYNGDDVGVLMTHDMKVNENGQKRYIAGVIFETLVANGGGSISLKAAALALMQSDTLYDKMNEGQVKSKIERALMGGVAVEKDDGNPGAITCTRQSKGGRDEVLITLS